MRLLSKGGELIGLVYSEDLPKGESNYDSYDKYEIHIPKSDKKDTGYFIFTRSPAPNHEDYICARIELSIDSSTEKIWQDTTTGKKYHYNPKENRFEEIE